VLKQVWRSLRAHSVFGSLLEPFEHSQPSEHTGQFTTWDAALAFHFPPASRDERGVYYTDQNDAIAFSCRILGRCVVERDNSYYKAQDIEFEVAKIYMQPTVPAKLYEDDWRILFLGLFVEPVFAYLTEGLENNSMILALLRRYKHKCEWFERGKLDSLWRSVPSGKGEWVLKLHLYEYLHDVGLDFAIDPYADTGKPDLIASQDPDDALIADAKLFAGDVSSAKRALIHGFNQVYTYTGSYNEPFGYLIVFNTFDEDIRLIVDGSSQAVPFVEHNKKTIFVLTINICPTPTSASKRGALSPIATIERSELVRTIDNANESSVLVPRDKS
jgi:hypothetical protein